MKSMLFFFMLASTLVQAQKMSKQDSLWLPFTTFIGAWKGTSEGQPGQGIYERSYQFILNKKFIEVRNKSTYPPSKNHPNGEVHEDIGYISYDNIRKTFVLRQFHVEGFVNQYSLQSISPDGKTIVFLSEAIENIPASWRAKETYEIAGDRELKEVFELSSAGKPFEVYSTAMLRKEN
ncbi:MAG: hypothetical protein ACOYXT_23045 [Bacteroidota bacterium]